MPRTKGSVNVAANVCGERVRIALMEARPAGLTLKQLMQATGMSAHHVRKGLNYIKDTSALEHLTPLTYDARNGYRFPVNVADWIAYELGGVQTLFNRASRLITSTIAPHAAARPEDEFARNALEQINGLKAGLAMIIMAGTHRRP
ncbi:MULTISPECIES: hypothetical protein [Actinomadura]|uniref:Uncharacterized protein n=1 Tax=Actinomadura yumaensis TaxID=111807 RepID=A0ABW2CD80_9ACTN|nr:hypothetical protein [Actinomadura sp. J1-007]MWK35635.1 hypothetical protein [Actinomadura sp. J1-007]